MTTLARTDVFGSTPRTARTPEAVRSRVRAGDLPDRLVVRTMTALLVGSVVLQNLVVPAGGSVFFVDILLLYAALAVLVAAGRLVISTTRVLLYVAAFGLATVLQTFVVPVASLGSMFLAMLIYAGYLGSVPASRATYMRVLGNFQYVAMAVCALVFLDLGVQLAGRPMPDISQIVPGRLLTQTYVYIQPIAYGSRIMKPNAFFMLEASFTSQFIALGLVMELAFWRRWRFMVVMLAGLLGTFASTGILLLAAAVPLLLRRYLRQALLVGIVAVPLLGGVAYVSGWTDVMQARLNTMDRADSSFNGRFVTPYTAMWDVLRSGSDQEVVAGLGAGAVLRVLEIAEYTAGSKALIEYGLPFFVLFMLFVTVCFFPPGVPFIVGWIVFVNYHFLSGNFHGAPTINYGFVLATGFTVGRRRRPASAPAEKQPESFEVRGQWRLPAPRRSRHLAVR